MSPSVLYISTSTATCTYICPRKIAGTLVIACCALFTVLSKVPAVFLSCLQHNFIEIMKKKRSKQPPRKIHLVFDERERREFLTGFQKRKKERQKKAQEKLMQEAKEEKRRLKAEKREILQRLLGDKPVPGSAADKERSEEEPVTYDLPDHTVTVTSLESSDLYGDVCIGDNRADNNEEEDDSSIGDEIERGRTTDSDKRRLKALDRQMGDCSVQLRAALHKDKKQRGKMRRIKLRTTKKAKLARTHRL